MQKRLLDYRWCSRYSIRLTKLDMIHMLNSSRSINFNEEKFKKYGSGRSFLSYNIRTTNSDRRMVSLLSSGKEEGKKSICSWEPNEQNTFIVEDGFVTFNPYFVSFGRGGKDFPNDLQFCADAKCLLCGEENCSLEVLDVGDRYECVCSDCYDKHKMYQVLNADKMIIRLLSAVARV